MPNCAAATSVRDCCSRWEAGTSLGAVATSYAEVFCATPKSVLSRTLQTTADTCEESIGCEASGRGVFRTWAPGNSICVRVQIFRLPRGPFFAQEWTTSRFPHASQVLTAGVASSFSMCAGTSL